MVGLLDSFVDDPDSFEAFFSFACVKEVDERVVKHAFLNLKTWQTICVFPFEFADRPG